MRLHREDVSEEFKSHGTPLANMLWEELFIGKVFYRESFDWQVDRELATCTVYMYMYMYMYSVRACAWNFCTMAIEDCG